MTNVCVCVCVCIKCVEVSAVVSSMQAFFACVTGISYNDKVKKTHIL